MLRIGLVIAVLATALSFTDAAQGGDIPLFNSHGSWSIASATWHSADPQVLFTAREAATTNLNQGESPPHQKHSDIIMWITQPGSTISSRATLSDDDFQVDGSLDRAVMNAVVPAEECSGVPFTCTDINLDIDLTWAASGPRDLSNRFHNKLFAQVCHINEVGSTVFPPAEVRGSISDGTRQFKAGLDTVEASISKARLAWTGRGDEYCL